MSIKKILTDIYLDLLAFAAAYLYAIFHWRNTIIYLVGISLASVSTILWVLSRFHLGKAFSVRAEATDLVTTGIYSKIRNPIYIFSFLALLGLVLAINKPYFYPFLLLLLVIQVKRSRKEAKVLLAKFGQRYLDYKSKTWF